MARKRLSPVPAARPDVVARPMAPAPAGTLADAAAVAGQGPGQGLPTGSAPEAGQGAGQGTPHPRARAPIAAAAGTSAAEAALETVSRHMEAARAAGRLAVALPLDAIVADHLARDRLPAGMGARAANEAANAGGGGGAPGGDPEAGMDEDMLALVESIRARGQQTPIEVVRLEGGRYGLISGWRRLTALRHLSRTTGEARFAAILAVERSPASAAEAYRAMVEENEIRVGLSYYERARIVAQTVSRGVYPDAPAALRGLFASASRARRSKIGAFVPIVEALDGALRFPAALPERLGLALSKALADAPDRAETLRAALADPAPTPEAEHEALRTALAALAPERGEQGEGPRPSRAPGADRDAKRDAAQVRAPGPAPTPTPTEAPNPSAHAPDEGMPAAPASAGDVSRAKHLSHRGPVTMIEEEGRVVLTGAGVTPAFRRALAAWLAARTK